jgi:hypothetical protein
MKTRRNKSRYRRHPSSALMTNISNLLFVDKINELFFSSSSKRAENAKSALLEKIAEVDKGASATDEDKVEIDMLAKKVERLQMFRKNSLEKEFINGKWELIYTTSASILGLSKPKLLRARGIYQTIDVKNLRAFNSEGWPFFNQVSAELTPTSKSAVDVQFKKFGLLNGLIKINAPDSAKGKLDTTYVDEDLRISRGDKGNLFVLTMDDPNAKLDREY